VETFWGAVMVAIGALFMRWGRTRSDFVVYRLLVARSQMLWRDRVHGFYQVTGAMIAVVGVLFAVLG
jgi:energy-converting hydrogenase Eha subunit E